MAQEKSGQNTIFDMLFSLLGVRVQEKLFFVYKHFGTRSYVGKNVFIAGNRLRRDGSCIIDYYKGYHPFGLGGNYIAIWDLVV